MNWVETVPDLIDHRERTLLMEKLLIAGWLIFLFFSFFQLVLRPLLIGHAFIPGEFAQSLALVVILAVPLIWVLWKMQAGGSQPVTPDEMRSGLYLFVFQFLVSLVGLFLVYLSIQNVISSWTPSERREYARMKWIYTDGIIEGMGIRFLPGLAKISVVAIIILTLFSRANLLNSIIFLVAYIIVDRIWQSEISYFVTTELDATCYLLVGRGSLPPWGWIWMIEDAALPVLTWFTLQMFPIIKG
jgi:hypothetical protein